MKKVTGGNDETFEKPVCFYRVECVADSKGRAALR
jgi:hypothetical protein